MKLSGIFCALLVLMDRGWGQVTSQLSSANASTPRFWDTKSSALVGFLYDLKQTCDIPPKPSGITRGDWRTVINRLVADNLNETDLSKYLKSTLPISANGFAIPEQASINGPIAFGLGSKAQPNLWLVIYHGKASVPETGKYRFVGFGDDILYVKLNGNAVFDGGWQSVTNDAMLHDTYPYVWNSLLGSTALLKKGAWFNVNQSDVVKLDILLGDWGGKCGYFLMLEKEGTKYDTASDWTTPKLPLFQVGAKIPAPKSGSETPPLSDSDVIWPAVNDN